MASSAQTLINSAASLGYFALSDRDLRECLLVAAQSGGGGGGSNPAPGVVNPNGVVSGSPGAVYFNTANSTVWIQGSSTTSTTGWIQTQ
jgi:hypothetical protein